MVVAFDAAGDGEVLHYAAPADIAKEALIIGSAVVDSEAADFEVLAVKGAGVGVFLAVADRSPGISFLFATDLAEVDIGGELGSGVGVGFAAVDFLGKCPQIVGAADLVHAIAVLLQPSALAIR